MGSNQQSNQSAYDAAKALAQQNKPLPPQSAGQTSQQREAQVAGYKAGKKS